MKKINPLVLVIGALIVISLLGQKTGLQAVYSRDSQSECRTALEDKLDDGYNICTICTASTSAIRSCLDSIGRSGDCPSGEWCFVGSPSRECDDSIIAPQAHCFGGGGDEIEATFIKWYTLTPSGNIQIIVRSMEFLSDKKSKWRFQVKNTGSLNEVLLIEVQAHQEGVYPFGTQAVIRQDKTCDTSQPYNVHTLFQIAPNEIQTITVTLPILPTGRWDIRAISYDSCCAPGPFYNPDCNAVSPYYDSNDNRLALVEYTSTQPDFHRTCINNVCTEVPGPGTWDCSIVGQTCGLTCTESDGGYVYTTKGWAQSTNKPKEWDSCKDTRYLYEKACPTPQSDFVTQTYDCQNLGSYKCEDGTCVILCTPKTCTELGKQCGNWDNGCGTQINCGTCSAGKTCQDGICVSQGGCISECTLSQSMNELCSDDGKKVLACNLECLTCLNYCWKISDTCESDERCKRTSVTKAECSKEGDIVKISKCTISELGERGCIGTKVAECIDISGDPYWVLITNCADSQKLCKVIDNWGQCTEPECTENSDCPSTEYCKSYECVEKECGEGSGEECEEGYECKNFICTKKGEEPIDWNKYIIYIVIGFIVLVAISMLGKKK